MKTRRNKNRQTNGRLFTMKGEWIAFFKEDGLLKIARNLENAAKVLGCNKGDQVFIKK